jgi:hypothetical protein
MTEVHEITDVPVPTSLRKKILILTGAAAITAAVLIAIASKAKDDESIVTSAPTA